MTPEQCREARRSLGWSEARLARAVGLAPAMISTFEQYGQLPTPAEDWQAKLHAALEEAGIEFVDDAPAVPIVRLRKGEV